MVCLSTVRALPDPICPEQPPTALAPMQDITHHTFMSVLHRYGDPDYYFNEYFRVHEHSKLDKPILKAIAENPTKRPVIAQFIGEDIESFKRMIEYLKPYPAAGIDLNMGCPAPKIYKKNVGGGLLRDMQKVDTLLGFLRDHIEGHFSVKCRLGFDHKDDFDTLLELFNKHAIDLLTVHGRTVKQMYRGDVDYALIKHAVQSVRCPVFANGNITCAHKAQAVFEETGCRGLMIGRSAIRNPWIFRQIREHFAGNSVFQPTLKDARAYVEDLYRATLWYELPPRPHVSVLKKYLNFVSQSVDAEGGFQYEMRRAADPDTLRAIADRYMLGKHADEPFVNEPYERVIARPNCES